MRLTSACIILHSLICRVLLLLLLLRNASDLRTCTSYFGACMWVWYCRPPIGAHGFPPHPSTPTRSPAIGGESAFTYCGSSFISQCDGYDVGISQRAGAGPQAARARRPARPAGPRPALQQQYNTHYLSTKSLLHCDRR